MAIIFCGPSPEILEKLGDKIAARDDRRHRQGADPFRQQRAADHWQGRHATRREARLSGAAQSGQRRRWGAACASSTRPEELAPSLEQAQRESLAAFGSSDVFLEKFIPRPRHIEVQLMGDKHGNLVHLYERDCSIQRRYQKVVEIAPSSNLDESLRDAICEAALRIGKAVNYVAAGTVEFLVDSETGKFYFIEVNPRIQVEHTVTEVVTGVDIVKCQILVSQGMPLDHPDIGLGKQDEIRTQGFAIPVPGNDRRRRESLPARLWPHRALSFDRRHRRALGCRHRVLRRGGHTVL